MTERAATQKMAAGKITSAYGIKGWVKIHSYTEPPDSLFHYGHWLLEGNSPTHATTPIVFDQHKPHGKGFVAHIKDIDDRTTAETLCRRTILVDASNLPPLPEGEYYWRDLIGLRVISHSDAENPIVLGVISDLMETGANDILVVSPCADSVDQRERLLPYVDAYVLHIDLAAGQMLVDWDPDF
jgi:16S rRNA processing protein RimM